MWGRFQHFLLMAEIIAFCFFNVMSAPIYCFNEWTVAELWVVVHSFSRD